MFFTCVVCIYKMQWDLVTEQSFRWPLLVYNIFPIQQTAWIQLFWQPVFMCQCINYSIILINYYGRTFGKARKYYLLSQEWVIICAAVWEPGANLMKLLIYKQDPCFTSEYKTKQNKKLENEFNNPHERLLTMFLRTFSACVGNYKGAVWRLLAPD